MKVDIKAQGKYNFRLMNSRKKTSLSLDQRRKFRKMSAFLWLVL